MSNQKTILQIGTNQIYRGQHQEMEIPIARLPNGSRSSLPITVLSGKENGPSIWITAALHGDEINGIEIIRQVSQKISPSRLKGLIILVPVVNVFGFMQESRYLPDRRDLNRCFPGSKNGSLGAQIASILMKEVITQCQYGIDLHTGSSHRYNIPQIRADLSDRETKKLALAFGAPIVMHSRVRDGSLREAATRKKIKTLLFEGGEPQRFNDEVIKKGVHGILRILNYLGMIESSVQPAEQTYFKTETSEWVRAKKSGIFKIKLPPSMIVKKGDALGSICDPFGNKEAFVEASISGMIVGYSNNPIVNRGDALVHIGEGKIYKRSL